jgi:hypothetical protein
MNSANGADNDDDTVSSARAREFILAYLHDG